MTTSRVRSTARKAARIQRGRSSHQSSIMPSHNPATRATTARATPLAIATVECLARTEEIFERSNWLIGVYVLYGGKRGSVGTVFGTVMLRYSEASVSHDAADQMLRCTSA